MAFRKLGKFYKECVRVLRVTKKPSGQEFKTVTKVTALGMVVIGAIGFIIMMIFTTFNFFG
jgi:protein transport protein SEC61 subunit gamma-like protein